MLNTTHLCIDAPEKAGLLPIPSMVLSSCHNDANPELSSSNKHHLDEAGLTYTPHPHPRSLSYQEPSIDRSTPVAYWYTLLSITTHLCFCSCKGHVCWGGIHESLHMGEWGDSGRIPKRLASPAVCCGHLRPTETAVVIKGDETEVRQRHLICRLPV